jgi:hypothetical protein
MISDYVGFQRYILLEFYLFVIWKEQHLCTLFGLQHSASKFVFQNSLHSYAVPDLIYHVLCMS